MHLRQSTFLLVALIGCAISPHRVSGQLTDAGLPTSIFVEVKQSLRLSLDFDAQLQSLAAHEASLGLTVERRNVGLKYLELLSFPSYFTEAQIQAAIQSLQSWPSVERVTASYAAFLVYPLFDQAFGPQETIPEAVKRGLASETMVFDPSVVLQPHAPNQLIVAWKPEFVWRAEQTGFLQRIAAFNASAGCRVISETRFSNVDLTQSLQFAGSDSLLANKMRRYLATGWVKYVQPNFSYSAAGTPVPRIGRERVPSRESRQRGSGPRQVN